jgi:hypothetical protein
MPPLPGTPTKLDRAATWAQIFGTVFVGVGLVLTSCQIGDASDAYRATTIYNLEKDWRDVFESTRTAAFTRCFAPTTEKATFPAPSVCVEEPAKGDFIRLLGYYNLLLSLEARKGLSKADVDERLKGGCRFLTSTGGEATISDLLQRGLFNESLRKRIQTTCGNPPGKAL